MSQVQLKSSGLWCTFLVFVMLFGMTTQTNSSVILSAITSQAPSLSGNASLSATSTFYGNLYSTNPTFSRPYGGSSSSYYYEIIQVTTYYSGVYTLTTSSTMNTFGCLYDTTFDPLNPYANLVAYDDDSGGSGQFLINYYLQSGRTYILVVTTSSPYVSGSYSLTATGTYSATLRGITMTTTTRSGYLSSSNPRFARPDRYSSDYYYESIRLSIYTSGLFSFKSSSATSTDLYGCLYDGSFNPSYPSLNKLVCDDDSAGGFQFQFSQSLNSYNTYVLVITTSISYTTGSYSVSVTGPSSVSMVTTTPNVVFIPVAAIISIIVGCFIFIFAITLGICICRRRQQIIVPAYNVYPTYPKQ